MVDRFSFAVQGRIDKEFGEVKSPTEGLNSRAIKTIASAPVTLPYAAANTLAGSVENIISGTVGRGIKFFDTDIFNEEKEKQRLHSLADKTGLAYAEMVADNFDENYQGIKTTADIATLFMGVGAISKGTQGAGKLAVLGNTKTGRTLFGDFTEVEKRFDDLTTINKEIATKDLGVITGAVDTERRLSEARAAVRHAQFNINPRKGKLGANVTEALATEVSIAALMNESEFFFPEGMNNWDYAQMAGFGLGLPLGIDKLRSVARMKEITQKAGETSVRSAREGLSLNTDAVTDDEILLLSGVRNASVKAQFDETANVSENLKSNTASLLNTNEQTQLRSINRLAAKADNYGAVNTQLTGDEAATVIRSINANPEMIAGTHSIEKVGSVNPVDMKFKIEATALPKIEKEIKELQYSKGKSANQILELETKKRQRDLLKNTQIKGIAQDGTTYDSKLPDAFDGVQAPQVKIQKAGRVDLGKDFQRLPNKQRHMRVTTAYAKMGAQVEGFTRNLGDKALVRFLENAAEAKGTYVDDDFVTEVLTQYGKTKGKNKLDELLAGSERIKSLNVANSDDFAERIRARSFKKKIDDFGRRSARGGMSDFTPLDLSRHYNLNLHTREAETSTNLLEYMQKRVGVVNKLSLEDIRGDYAQFTKSMLNDVTQEADTVLDITGSNLTLRGKPLAIQRDMRKQNVNQRNAREIARVADETQKEISTRLVNYGETIEGDMRRINAPNLVKIAMRETFDEFSEQFSKDVMNVFAGADRTAANDTLAGRIAAQVLPQDKNFKNHFVNAFQYAAQINKSISNKYEQAAKDYLKSKEKIFQQIRLKDNAGDLLSLQVSIRSFGQGWDIAKGSKFEAGKLRIDDTVANRAKASKFGLSDETVDRMFREGSAEMPDVTQLAKGIYQPVGITPLASQALEALREADKVTKLNRNAVRAANNVQVIDDEILSLPNAMNKYEQTVIVHEVGTNKIVTISNGKDVEAALKNADAYIKSARETRSTKDPVLVAKPAIQFKAETGQTPMNQGFDVSKVDTALVPTNPAEVLDVMLKSIIRDWGSVSADVINARFKREINFLEHMEKGLRNADSNIVTGKSRNVYSEVKNRLLGIDTQRPSGLLITKFMNGIDNMGDALFTETARVLDPFFVRAFDKKGKASKALDDIAAKTGYRPAQDFLEINGIKTDVKTEDVARKMNAVAGFWMLRFMELGQTLLNVTTIPTILPTVGKTLGRRPKETFDEYRTRVGAFANVMGDNAPAQMNPMKLMIAGVHDMFTDEGRKVYTRAKEMGNLDASVVETHDIIFEGGKRYADPSVWQKFKNIATSPTDFTEGYSRAVSYMAGYRLFKNEAPELSDAALHKLSNWFADQNVGDYAKITRPDQFKGGVGSALGLFQTFATNFGQRFARAVESGDNKTIATQFSTQGLVFGLESIPGYDQFTQAWTSYDGTQSPWESLVEAYGVDYTEILSTGAVSNIPRLFGGSGIALHTRGDTNIRGIPNITQIDQVPAVTMAKKFLQAGFNAGKLVKQEGTGTSAGRLLEIAASGSPSRSIKGALEIINGRAVDRNGGLVTDKTRELESVVARLMGSKPMAEQRAGTMMFRQRGMQQRTNARVAIMRNNFAAKIRDQGMSKELVNEMLERYIDEHKNPATFKRWLVELNKKAQYSKSHRELLRTYKRMNNGQTSKYADKQTLRFYQLIAADPNAATEFGQ